MNGTTTTTDLQERRIVIVSIALFVSTSYYWLCYHDYKYPSKRVQRAQQQARLQQQQLDSTILNNNNTAQNNYDSNNNSDNDNDEQQLANKTMVSLRGLRIAMNTTMAAMTNNMYQENTSSPTALVSSMSYIDQFLIAIQNLCTLNTTNTGNSGSSNGSLTNTTSPNSKNNRSGYIPLCVAENKLCLDVLADRFNQDGTCENAFNELYTYCYNNVLGIPVARDSAAYFLAKRFYRPYTTTTTTTDPNNNTKEPDEMKEYHVEDALLEIQSKYVVIGAGAGPILSNLFYILGDVDDICMIPAPYYATFEYDMNVMSGIIPFAIQDISNVLLGPNVRELEIAYFTVKSTYGKYPKFLLLSNPNNPLGIIYPPTVMVTMITWARSKNLHIIVDEIYALSIHKPSNATITTTTTANTTTTMTGSSNFQSILQILDNKLLNDVHMVYALSKDFGASGLRYGILYTQNDMLLQGLSKLHMVSGCGGVPGPMQHMVSELLTDDAFLDHYLYVSRQRTLYSLYNVCIPKLDEMVIPYIIPEAGIFIYIDLSSLLPCKTVYYERQLTQLVRILVCVSVCFCVVVTYLCSRITHSIILLVHFRYFTVISSTSCIYTR